MTGRETPSGDARSMSFSDVFRLYKIPAMIAVLGLVISFLIFTWALHTNLSGRLKDFNTLATLNLRIIHQSFKVYGQEMQFLRNFFMASDFVSHDEFKDFSGFLLENEPFVSATWLKYKNHQYEPTYRVGEGSYAFDIDTLPALTRFKSQGEILYNYDSSGRVDLIFPLDKDDGTQGILVGTVSLEKLFEQEYRADKNLMNVRFYLYDAQRAEWPVYYLDPKNTNIKRVLTDLLYPLSLESITVQNKHVLKHDVEVLDKKWIVLMMPTDSYLAQSVGVFPWIILCFGLAFTWVLSYLIFRTTRENVRVEREIKRQTKALADYNEKLQHSNQELDEFAYIASHDLKAPLRVIDNTSSWLAEDLDQYLDDDSRDNIRLMRSRVKRMERLLDDLLEYSRIGRKQDDRYKELIDGDDMMEDIILLLSPPEGFAIRYDNDFSRHEFYRMPLQQVIYNLVGNAIKHHDKDQGCVNIKVKDIGDFYQFDIEDDGPGIPEEFREQVFKMFKTLKPRDQVEGSGVGLAIVQKHINYFGGTIQLKPNTINGCIFSFTWPKKGPIV